MTVKISSLRVTADMNPGPYLQGMAAKVGADREGVASSKDVGIAMAQMDAAMAKSGAGTDVLSRRWISGFKHANDFEKAIRSVGRSLGETSEVDPAKLERAGAQIESIYRHFGLTADAASLQKQGFVTLVPLIEKTNQHYAEQARLLAEQTEESKRLAHAEQARVTQAERVQAYLAKVDPAAMAAKMAQERFNTEVEEANELYARNAISLGHYEAGITRAQVELDAATRRVTGNSAAVGLNRHQWLNLSYQLNDVATMLASGSSPFQVMATQSGQVFQVLQTGPGGVVGSLRSIGSTVASVLTPVRALAGGFVALGIVAGVSAYQAASDYKTLESALQGVGRQSNLTIADLQGAINVTGDLSGVTDSMATAMAAAYAKTGKIGKENLTDLMALTNDYASATGKDLDAAMASLTKAMTDPSKGAEELHTELGFLTLTTLENIRALEMHGRKTEAQKVLLNAVSNDIPKARERLTLLGRTWLDVADAIDTASSAIGRWYRAAIVGPNLDEQIAAAKREMETAQQYLTGGRFVNRQIGTAALEQATQKYTGLLAEQDKQQRELNRSKEEQALLDGDALRRSRDPRIAELSSLIEQETSLTNAYNKAKADGNQARANLFNETRSGIKNQIDVLTGGGKDLLSAADILRRESRLQAQISATQNDPVANRAARRAWEEYQARKEGASDAEVAARGENMVLMDQIQLQQQLSQAARDRILTIDESIAQAQIEMSMIGATAEERERLTANLRAEQDLRREAAQNGTAVDLAQLAVIKAKNAELAHTNALLREASLRDDLMFDRDQLFRSGYDQQIASALRGAGLKVDLNSDIAQFMRLNQTLADTRDVLADSFGSFTQDIMNGVSAGEALTNVLTNISNKLISMAAEQLVAEALGGLVGGSKGGMSSGGGLVSLIGGLLGGGGGVSWYANGGVVNSPALSAYSNSIVTQPTMFAFAKGTGLMGEAGPEAIMPLSRGRDGKLGVQASGGLVGERSGGGGSPRLSVNIQTLPGTTADVSEPKPDGNGGFSVDVIMRQVKAALVDDARRMGPVASAYQGRFGLNPTRGMG